MSHRIGIPILTPDQEKILSDPEPYYPYLDITRPVCRNFVNQGKCSRGSKCRFYHPSVITPIVQQQAIREFNLCYCGAAQKKVLNKRPYLVGEDPDIPTFYVLCSRTGKSMKNCM